MVQRRGHHRRRRPHRPPSVRGRLREQLCPGPRRRNADHLRRADQDARGRARHYPYSIPVLAERDLVLEAVARIRESVDPTLDNKTYSQRFGKEVGIAAKRTFSDMDNAPITPRELREAYSAVAYHKFASRKISEVQFYNEVLGHQGTDLNTSLFYFAFYVVDGDE